MNTSIRAKLSVGREPAIGQTLIDMRGRKPAWEGIEGSGKFQTYCDGVILLPPRRGWLLGVRLSLYTLLSILVVNAAMSARPFCRGSFGIFAV